MTKLINDFCASASNYCRFMGWNTRKKLKQSVSIYFNAVTWLGNGNSLKKRSQLLSQMKEFRGPKGSELVVVRNALFSY